MCAELEKRFGSTRKEIWSGIRRTIFLFATLFEYVPKPANNSSLGNKTLKGIFLGCVSRAGGGCPGDLLPSGLRRSAGIRSRGNLRRRIQNPRHIRERSIEFHCRDVTLKSLDTRGPSSDVAHHTIHETLHVPEAEWLSASKMLEKLLGRKQ